MGIKSLNPFLKEKVPQCFRDIPYSFFRGKRVAVDSDNVLRKLMSRSHKEIVNQTDVCFEEPDRTLIVERWLFHIKEELLKFLYYGITLIFIFDGSYIDEKSETQIKRREEKEKRIREAQEKKDEILQLDELERTPQMITDLRKKMHHLGTIKHEDKELIIQILEALGIPVLHATEEGEKLCAMLCIEGKVDAVYSRDTDVVALGAPLSFSEEAGWVYNTHTQKTELSLKCTLFKPILGALEMEYSSFLDLCIMGGCDFNSNIFRVGIKTSYKILKECKSIENLPSKYDKTILNYERCREIFSRQKAKDICKTNLMLNIDHSKIYEESEIFSKIDWKDEIVRLWKNFPVPSDICFEKAPSYSSSMVRLKIINKKSEEEIPQQKASPIRLNNKMIASLASNQLERFKERNIKLKVIQ